MELNDLVTQPWRLVEHARAASFPSTSRQCLMHKIREIRSVTISNSLQYQSSNNDKQPTQSPDALPLVHVNVTIYWTRNIYTKNQRDAT
jgi:hypothetical protein